MTWTHVLWLIAACAVLAGIDGYMDTQKQQTKFIPISGAYDYQQFVEREEDGK